MQNYDKMQYKNNNFRSHKKNKEQDNIYKRNR